VSTHEPCPTCGAEAECQHLGDTHVWDCPECGEILAIVCYPCPNCAALRSEEEK